MLLSQEELERLTERYNQWHVSITMPTRKAGDEIRQNAVRFENLLDEAEEHLVEAGMRRPEAQRILNPARALVEDEIFWQHQSDGLAVFLADGLARKYRLPLEFEQLAVVSDRFHLKPLLKVLSNNGRFYVLAVSQHETRLLQGTRHRIGEIDLDAREQVPETTVEVLKWEDPERRLEYHTATESTFHHGVEAVFHGHGVASEDDPKEKIKRFFDRLDAGVSDLLADDDAPLVPVGDDFVLARYREANSYPYITEEGVPIEPQQLSMEELHTRAWSVVHPLFERAQEQARSVYEHLHGTESERASNDVEEIISAAVFERVEGLFVAQDQQVWGTFDPQSGEVAVHDEQQPGDRDLLSLAAVQTMLNEGWLFVVNSEEVPGGAPAAAVFRY